jgi:hypothetical protein
VEIGKAGDNTKTRQTTHGGEGVLFLKKCVSGFCEREIVQSPDEDGPHRATEKSW